MAKTDFKKTLKYLYSPSAKDFTVVEVPPMQFLMVDGHGDPNRAQEYKDALEALYAVAYKTKFLCKNGLGKDYVVPPLEGLWWADDMTVFSSGRDKNAWDWTMMIMQPDWVRPDLVEESVRAVEKKGLPALPKLRLEEYDEGLSVQILHVGSYENEGPTLARLHNEWVPENGYATDGKHHEIYLGDPRRVAPEKLRTVLRQPIRQI